MFLAHPEQIEVVKKFLTPERFDISSEMSNEQVGEEYRARERARELINTAFQVMENYKKTEPTKDNKNPAR